MDRPNRIVAIAVKPNPLEILLIPLLGFVVVHTGQGLAQGFYAILFIVWHHLFPHSMAVHIRDSRIGRRRLVRLTHIPFLGQGRQERVTGLGIIDQQRSNGILVK